MTTHVLQISYFFLLCKNPTPTFDLKTSIDFLIVTWRLNKTLQILNSLLKEAVAVLNSPSYQAQNCKLKRQPVLCYKDLRRSHRLLEMTNLKVIELH